MSVIKNHISRYRKHIHSKSFMLDMFTECSKVSIDDYVLNDDELKVSSKIYYYMTPGRLFTLKDNDSKYYYCVDEIKDRDRYIIRMTDILIPSKEISKLADILDDVTITKEDIDNLTNQNSVKTIYGSYILNIIMLSEITGSIFEYDNDIFDYFKYEKRMCELSIMGKVTPSQIREYVDRISFMDSMVESFLPTLTEELITMSPEVKKLLNELLRKHKDELSDPSILVMIEKKVVEADKEALSNDKSSAYTSNKTFDIQRKRMFSMFGVMEQFGEYENGIDFLTTNLDDGWKKEELPILLNDIRKGIAGRALDTANGGVLAKRILQSFQSLNINNDDCKTTKGIPVVISKDRLYEYVVDKGKSILLTDDNISKYIGKYMVVRSPLTCKTDGVGYCYKCFGEKYKKLNITLLASEIINLGSDIMYISMKSMHGKASGLLKLDIDDFII